MKRSIINAAILGALGFGAAMPLQSFAANINLCAGEFTIPAGTAGYNNPDPIVMWGYSLGQGEDTGCTGTLTSPGPTIQVLDNTLSITLYNKLPRNTSLVIPGLIKQMTPVMFPAPDGTTRVHSFDTEVAPNGNHTYTWNNVPNGSYMYQSGTHQQVQVQMGLAGGMMVHEPNGGNNNPGVAYPGMTGTEQPLALIYSEIDPLIHAGVAAGSYNTADMQSTIDYAPKYFALTLDSDFVIAPDGQDNWNSGSSTVRQSTMDGSAIDVNVPAGATPLFRLFNASTRIHVPTLIGGNFDVIAEDGKLYPNYRKQYAVGLPPLKTKDAILDASGISDAGGTIKLTDSAMNLSNPSADIAATYQANAADDVISNGNDTVHGNIHIAAAAGYSAPVMTSTSPVARRDEVRVSEGGSVAIDVLANDDNATIDMLDVVTAPSHGTLSKTATGFEYQHLNGENTRDSFLYSLNGEPMSMAAVVIEIDPQNDAPVAADDSVTMTVGQQIEVRVLDNDTDADSYNLAVVSVDTSGFGLGDVSFVDKAVTVTGSTAGTGVIVYTVDDGDGGSDTASISVNVVADTTGTGGEFTNGDNTSGSTDSVVNVEPPIATEDYITIAENGTYDVRGNALFSVLVNDVANGGKVTMEEFPEHGSIDMLEDGTFMYIHDGSEDDEDHFTYTVYNDGGSDKAEVKINISSSSDAPKVNDDKVKISMNETVEIDILANDEDEDSTLRKATIEIVSGKGPSHGTVSVGADNNVTYTPDSGFTGKDSFKYRLYDDVTGEASDRKGKVKIKVK